MHWRTLLSNVCRCLLVPNYHFCISTCCIKYSTIYKCYWVNYAMLLDQFTNVVGSIYKCYECHANAIVGLHICRSTTCIMYWSMTRWACIDKHLTKSRSMYPILYIYMSHLFWDCHCAPHKTPHTLYSYENLILQNACLAAASPCMTPTASYFSMASLYPGISSCHTAMSSLISSENFAMVGSIRARCRLPCTSTSACIQTCLYLRMFPDVSIGPWLSTNGSVCGDTINGLYPLPVVQYLRISDGHTTGNCTF